MQIDLKGFKVIYDNKVYNTIAVNNIVFDDEYDPDNHFDKPDTICVWIIDEDNKLVLIHDKADRFQFVRSIE